MEAATEAARDFIDIVPHKAGKSDETDLHKRRKN